MLRLLRKIYALKQNTLYTSTLVVASTLVLARVFGLVKLRVLTTFYTQQQLDLFFAAFRLPDFIFEIFVAGSIASCFIPIISDVFDGAKENKREALKFAQSLSVIFLFCWVAFLILMHFYAAGIVRLLVPGYTESQVAQVTQMSTTILFYQVPFLLLGNIVAALLQASHQFLVPGFAPAFYNLGIIIGILFWHDQSGIYGAIFGVILGSVLYCLSLLLGLILLGFPLKLEFDFFNKRVMAFFRLFWPRFFNSITTQIDATVDLALSTLRGVGSYTAFYLARSLQILPVSFFGIALSQSVLPFFASLYHQGKKKELLDLLMKLILQIIFVMLPIVIFFTALRIPLVRLFFGGQKFAWEATVTTANVLSVFALSLPSHTVYYVITRAYFAIQDTRTPFITGLIFTALNTFLSVVFINFYRLPIWYLALSFSISITLNSAVLLIILLKRLDSYRLPNLIAKLSLMAFVTVTTLAIVWTTKRLLDGLIFDTTRTLNLFLLTLFCVLVGLSTYLYLAWVFLPQQLNETLGLLSRLGVLKKTLSRYRQALDASKILIPGEDQVEDKILK